MFTEPKNPADGAVSYPGLSTQPDRSASRRWPLLQAGRRFLRTQFGRPTGLWGDIAGRLMARDSSNLARIEWTLSLLDIRPEDHILEVGYGPGVAIQRASQLASRGLVTGVDHSPVMMRHAVRRNAAAQRSGRVDLRLGSVSELPRFEQQFDKIFSINSIHFWHDPVDCLKGLHALLRPLGIIAITIQPRSRGANDATAKAIGEEIAGKLRLAGFTRVRVELRHARPVAVACALGIR